MNKVGRPAGAHTQAVRVVKILRRLYGGEVLQLDELADNLDVTERTIRRDLSAIRRGGLHIRMRKTKFWLVENKSLNEQIHDKRSLKESLKQAKENWI